MFLFSTSSLDGYGLHHIFQLAKNGNFSGIDLSVDFTQHDSYDPTYIKEISAMTGIGVKSITAPERKLSRKHCDQLLSLAHELGVNLINLHPPHRLDREKDWFGEYLQTINKKYPDITISIINAPPKTWLFLISEYGDARPETIKKITGHTALSIENVDPSSGVDLIKTFILLGSTIRLVYLSDKDDEKTGLFPGEGTMPLESLLIKMKEVEYSGYFSLTVDPASLMAGEKITDILTRMGVSHTFLSRYFG